MLKTAREAAEVIKKHRHSSIDVVSHMDSDGVCAAAVLSKALDRLDIKHNVKFVRMLYKENLQKIDAPDLTIFTDLGSSQLSNIRGKFLGKNVIIADHHEPEDVDGWPELVHLNAHKFGVDGMHEISGAGMAYLIARELDVNNKDLAATAMVGAIGDIQNVWGGFSGHNREILQDAIDAGVIEKNMDLLLYGRHSRPIFKSLEYFSDPAIPGVSNSAAGCVSLLKELGIDLKHEGKWRRPVDLKKEEKQRLASELISLAYTNVPDDLVKYVPSLVVGETYTMRNESERSMLKDADEFSTCLNSTARHEQPLIGLEVAKGDRKTYYRAMLNLIKYHRRNIAEGLDFVEASGLKHGPKDYIQYFDATGEVKETFIGTIASLALGNSNSDPYRPIVGIVSTDGMAKASARCSKLLFLRGLDMAKAMKAAAKAVGGEGGGHAVACGAQVEEGRVQEFLQRFEERLVAQLEVS